MLLFCNPWKYIRRGFLMFSGRYRKRTLALKWFQWHVKSFQPSFHPTYAAHIMSLLQQKMCPFALFSHSEVKKHDLQMFLLIHWIMYVEQILLALLVLLQLSISLLHRLYYFFLNLFLITGERHCQNFHLCYSWDYFKKLVIKFWLMSQFSRELAAYKIPRKYYNQKQWSEGVL